MNKAQLVETLASEVNITKADCERLIDTMVDTIKKTVKKGDDLTLVGFGTFTRSKRKARVGRNPQTGEMKWADPKPASTAVKVRALKKLKDMV